MSGRTCQHSYCTEWTRDPSGLCVGHASAGGYERGQRVIVDGTRTGTVAYVRMAPPGYTTVAAVSVVLDSERHRPGYTGSIFPADRVKVTP